MVVGDLIRFNQAAALLLAFATGSCSVVEAAQMEDPFPGLDVACPGAAAYIKRQASDPDAEAQAEAPSHPALRDEIKAMVARDQEARSAMVADQTNSSKQAAIASIDATNLTRLKAIIAEVGFPTRAMVGGAGAQEAWLLTQHADQDPAFQREMLAILKTRTEHDVRPEDIALLEDRVLVHEGKPQRYGSQFTQVNGTMQPQPIEDPTHVDERRARMHLMPLADYTCVMQHLYSAKK